MEKFQQMLDTAKTLAKALGLVVNMSDRKAQWVEGVDSVSDHRLVGNVVGLSLAFFNLYGDGERTGVSTLPGAYDNIENGLVSFLVMAKEGDGPWLDAAFNFKAWRGTGGECYMDIWFEEDGPDA